MDKCLIRTKTPNGYMAVLKDGWRFDDSQIVEATTLAELELKLATARCDDWKTINGAHVLIGKTGRILGGAGGAFTGKVFGQPFKGRKRVLKAQGKGKKKGNDSVRKELSRLEQKEKEAHQKYKDAIEKQAIFNDKIPEKDAWKKAATELREFRDKQAKAGVPFISEEYTRLKGNIDAYKIKSVPVKRLDKQLTSEEIVAKIGGQDRTKGSCMSLAMVYIANKHGYDVLDFRGGKSQDLFSRSSLYLAKLDKTTGGIESVKVEATGAMAKLKTAEVGKEYLFTVGRHASIVRNNGGKLEYLELQSTPERNGWHDLDRNVLVNRFSAAKSQRRVGGTKLESRVVMVDVDSYKNSKELPEIMQYINTNEGQEMKGVGGYAK